MSYYIVMEHVVNKIKIKKGIHLGHDSLSTQALLTTLALNLNGVSDLTRTLRIVLHKSEMGVLKVRLYEWNINY
jgi:hypothetical protein